ncbi:MAG: hypothetical protein ACRDXB_17575, partial [Actinomycetes bacterium]
RSEGRGVWVLRVHQAEQCPHGVFRRAFIGPDDESGANTSTRPSLVTRAAATWSKLWMAR